MKRYRVVNSEFAQWAKSQPDSQKFHAAMMDAPYGLEFMGKAWDAPHKATSFPKSGNLGGFADGNKPSFARQGNIGAKYQAWVTDWAAALAPLLYPGAIVFCFGGTRTWHRLASGFEDAGFQVWDTLCWLHGQGFPKAQDISKLIDKSNGTERIVGAKPDRWTGKGNALNFSTDRPQAECKVTEPGSPESAPWSGHKTCALKPAWEPVLCFRAPSGGKSYAELATEFGSGCLNVDGGRVAVTEKDARDVGRVITRNVRPEDGWGFNGDESDRTEVVKANGRYPANVALDEESAELLDGQSGKLISGANPEVRHSDMTRGIYGEFKGHKCFPYRGANVGGASRFFYTAKADQDERHSFNEVNPSSRNTHPTVKPIDLCRWLASLLLPPDHVQPRRLLIPFSGSGSEMIGALQAGWDEVIGVDQESEYCRMAPLRIEHHLGLLAEVLA